MDHLLPCFYGEDATLVHYFIKYSTLSLTCKFHNSSHCIVCSGRAVYVEMAGWVFYGIDCALLSTTCLLIGHRLTLCLCSSGALWPYACSYKHIMSL